MYVENTKEKLSLKKPNCADRKNVLSGRYLYLSVQCHIEPVGWIQYTNPPFTPTKYIII